MSVRQKPAAVRLEWPEGPHKGREVIYSYDPDGGSMSVNMADSLLPMPRVTMRPDSPMALRKSRHPITEAGFETIVAQLESTRPKPALRGQRGGPAFLRHHRENRRSCAPVPQGQADEARRRDLERLH